MKYKNKIVSIFLLIIFTLSGLSCAKQTAQSANSGDNTGTTVVSSAAQSPTEAYKMLFAACKAKDSEKVKSLMSKNSLALAEFNASNQKITLEKSLENGLVAPTMAPAITEIRDERIKDNYGAIEVFNQKDNRWEDLPFVLENGGWKLAVGDIFQDKYKSPGKGQAEIEREASNTMTMIPANKLGKMPAMSANKQPVQELPPSEGKSVEVPKEVKPKK